MYQSVILEHLQQLAINWHSGFKRRLKDAIYLQKLRYYVKSTAVGGCLILLPLLYCQVLQANTSIKSVGAGNFLYSGRVGPQQIVMELHVSKNNRVIGRYFTLDNLQDRPVVGKINAFSLSLTQTFAQKHGNVPRRGFTLFYTPISPNLNGYWSDRHGRKISTHLTPLDVAPPAANTPSYWKKLYQKSPYEYSRLLHVHLKKGKLENFMGYQLQWWFDPLSHIAYFTIAAGYPTQIEHKINNELKVKMWNAIQQYNYCVLNAYNLKDTYYQQKVTPELINSNLLSINVTTHAFCGGLEPIYVDTPINLNAHTGSLLTLEDLLWLGKKQPFTYGFNQVPRNSSQENAYFAYRDVVLAPWLLNEFAKIYPQRIQQQQNKSCDYSNERLWSLSAWYLTPQGISFCPYLPFGSTQCNRLNWSLPYSVIKQHPGKESGLLKVTKGS